MFGGCCGASVRRHHQRTRSGKPEVASRADIAKNLVAYREKILVPQSPPDVATFYQLAGIYGANVPGSSGLPQNLDSN